MFSRNCLRTIDFKSDPCNLELSSSELKNIRTCALTKTNQHVKYESFVINSSQDNEQKPFFYKKDPSDLDL